MTGSWPRERRESTRTFFFEVVPLGRPLLVKLFRGMKEVGVNVGMPPYGCFASGYRVVTRSEARARGPLDRDASLARAVLTHRYARRDTCTVRSAEVLRVLGVDVVQQQFNVQGTFRLAWLCDATDAKRFEKDPKTFIPSWIPSISWSNKVAFNATPLAQDHGGLYSVESRASDKATVIYHRCDFDGVNAPTR